MSPRRRAAPGWQADPVSSRSLNLFLSQIHTLGLRQHIATTRTDHKKNLIIRDMQLYNDRSPPQCIFCPMLSETCEIGLNGNVDGEDQHQSVLLPNNASAGATQRRSVVPPSIVVVSDGIGCCCLCVELHPLLPEKPIGVTCNYAPKLSAAIISIAAANENRVLGWAVAGSDHNIIFSSSGELIWGSIGDAFS